MLKLGGSTLGTVLFLASGAHAGVYIEMSDHDIASGKTTPRHNLYLQQGMLRSDSTDGHTSVIFKDDSMFLLDSSTKTYRVLDKASMGQLAGKMNDMMASMQARMASMPPEQRAAMERAMQGMGQNAPGAGDAPKAHTFDAQNTGTSGTAGGRSCHIWNTVRDGKNADQLCVVPVSSLPGSGEVLAAIKNAAALNMQIQEAMQARGGAAGAMASNSSGMMSQSMNVMEKIDGIPVATRHFDAATGALATTEMVMTQWQQRALDPAQFEIPPGFSRKDFMENRHP